MKLDRRTIESMPGYLWQFLALFVVLTVFPSIAAAERLESFTEPYQRIAVSAPEIGVIAEVLVKEGDEVSPKQVLANLDSRVLRASLEVARAAKDALGARRSAETEMTIRENQLKSYRKLHQQGNASARELERAETEFQQAALKLQSIREDLEVRRLEYERVKAQINQRRIESPIDGVVVAIDKEVGDFVSITDPVVLHVVHLKTLKAVFSVPRRSADDLRTGQRVPLLIGYDEASCEGEIEFVSPVTDAESNSVRVKVRIANDDDEIRSGVACRWNLQGETPSEETAQQAFHGILNR